MNLAKSSRLESLSDNDLMVEIAENRSEDALAVLHRRYRTVLRSVISRVLYLDADADDVLQDVFIQVWLQAHNYSPGKGQLLGWLITVARRRALDRARQSSAYQKATARYEQSCKPTSGVDETSIVDREVRQNELQSVLNRLIDDLPKEQGIAVQLTYFKGLSQREIATRLSLPLGTVKTRIDLAMRKLTRSYLCHEAA